MKPNPTTFGLSAAIAAAVLWSLYSGIALFFLIVAMNVSGDLAYTDFGNFDWKFFVGRFLAAGVALSLGAGMASWLVAVIYNFVSEISTGKLP